jgi:hypothetical protein
LAYFEGSIEYLIKSWPNLRKLRLFDGILYLGTVGGIPLKLNLNMILDLLSRTCPHLESLQISIFKQRLQAVTGLLYGRGFYPIWRRRNEIVHENIFPHLKELAFSDQELSPSASPWDESVLSAAFMV